jgi:translation initiation factor 2 subunit 1
MKEMNSASADTTRKQQETKAPMKTKKELDTLSTGLSDAEEGTEEGTTEYTVEKCRFLHRELPQPGDIVMIKVTNVDLAAGAYCELLEYDGRSALIIASELSRKRIRSIKQVIGDKEEAAMVLRVDEEKGYVDLSRRRLEPGDEAMAKERFTKAKVVHSLFSRVAAVTGVPLEALLRALVWPLYQRLEEWEDRDPPGEGDGDSVGSEEIPPRHPFDELHMALHDWDAVFGPFAEAFIQLAQTHPSRHLSVEEALQQCMRRRLKMRPIKMQAVVEVVCPFGGLRWLQYAFAPFAHGAAYKGHTIRLTITAPPVYTLSVESLDKPAATAALEEAAGQLAKVAAQGGGKLTYIRTVIHTH